MLQHSLNLCLNYAIILQEKSVRTEDSLGSVRGLDYHPAPAPAPAPSLPSPSSSPIYSAWPSVLTEVPPGEKGPRGPLRSKTYRAHVVTIILKGSSRPGRRVLPAAYVSPKSCLPQQARTPASTPCVFADMCRCVAGIIS